MSLNILIADDERAARFGMAKALTQAGYHIDEAADGPAALAAIRSGLHDLVFLDLNMPGMNGLELASAIRKRGDLMPAILMTSDPNRSVRARAAAANVPVIDKLNLADSLVSHVKEVMKARLN